MVEHWDPQVDGELNEATMRTMLEARGYTVNRYIYPPGTSFPAHSYDVAKMDGVLSGQFKMTMGGRSVILGAGDCLAIPKGVIHSAEVIAKQAVVSLDAVKG